MNAPASKPLTGIRVVSLAAHLPGPIAAAQLDGYVALGALEPHSAARVAAHWSYDRGARVHFYHTDDNLLGSDRLRARHSCGRSQGPHLRSNK